MTQAELPQPAVKGGQKDGRSIGANTYKTHPEHEPESWPNEPTDDTGSNIESGRG